MQKMVWKGTFAEAEQREDEYWANQTPQYRLKTLIDLREMLYPDCPGKIALVAYKRKIGDEEE